MVSITLISTFCRIIGSSTRVCLPRIPNKAVAGSSSPTKKYSREIFTQTASKDLGSFYEKMGQLFRASGEIPVSSKFSTPMIFINEHFPQNYMNDIILH